MARHATAELRLWVPGDATVTRGKWVCCCAPPPERVASAAARGSPNGEENRLSRTWKSRVGVLALAATMGIGLVGLAGPAGAGTKGVPFKASASGTFVSNFPNLSYSGTGSASHLGKISYSSSSGFFTFTETLTAANGDTLTLLDYTTIVSPTEATGTWTVTGGTGRFSAATGTGTSDTIHTGGTNFTQSWNGTLAY